MGFDFRMKYVPRDLIAHGDVLSRIDFDKDESDNDRLCVAIINNFFAQSDLLPQAEIPAELGTNRLFQDI